MNTLKEIIQFAQDNPNDPRNIELNKGLTSGIFDDMARDEGIDLSPVSQSFKKQKDLNDQFSRVPQNDGDNSFAQKAGNFLGIDEFGEATGKAIAAKTINKLGQESIDSSIKQQGEIVERIKIARKNGDIETLNKLLPLIDSSNDAINKSVDVQGDFVDDLPSNRQVIGSAGNLGTLAIGGAGVSGALNSGSRAAKLGKLAGLGAVENTLFTAGMTAADEDRNATAGELAGSAALGATVGVVAPVAIAGLARGTKGIYRGVKSVVEPISKRIKNINNSNKVREIMESIKVNNNFIDPDSVNVNILKDSLDKQFDETQSLFLSSLNKVDKETGKKMIDMAERASVDARSIDRPLDIVSESLENKYKPILEMNQKFGSEVDKTATSLRGKQIDIQPLKNIVTESLEELNIKNKIIGDGDDLVLGLDFTDSVFNRLPKVQKQLSNVFDDVNNLNNDAYRVHIFKKSIDEIVDFGKKSDGLTATAERTLKKIRANADELLDNSFAEYKVANDNFRITKEVVNQTDSLFGKNKMDKSRIGNKLRALFSNQQSRTQMRNYLMMLDDIGEQYNIATADNLTDQSLLVEILESVYGTQATTSLQGEVSKAIQGASGAVNFFKNPLGSVKETVGGIVQESLKRDDISRRNFLKEILN